MRNIKTLKTIKSKSLSSVLFMVLATTFILQICGWSSVASADGSENWASFIQAAAQIHQQNQAYYDNLRNENARNSANYIAAQAQGQYYQQQQPSSYGTAYTPPAYQGCDQYCQMKQMRQLQEAMGY